MNITLSQTQNSISLSWDNVNCADCYRILWKDSTRKTMDFLPVRDLPKGITTESTYTFYKLPIRPYVLKVEALCDLPESDASSKENSSRNTGSVIASSKEVITTVTKTLHPQTEKLSRGLIAVSTPKGIFLAWRMLRNEVTGSTKTGLTGCSYRVYRNNTFLSEVTDSTNYLDADGTMNDQYQVSCVHIHADDLTSKNDLHSAEDAPCSPVFPFASGSNYLDLPLQKPEDGVTPAGEPFSYHANDMSVGDVDGDGEYEFFVKWDPSNSHDVSIKGYTGRCYIDCYKLSGRLLWRLDMGPNIRAGAHYTQFMVFDFNGDGKSEMSVKTAPGTHMTIYDKNGGIAKEYFISIPKTDRDRGIKDTDCYVCSSSSYRDHMKKVFLNWQDLPDVKTGAWPSSPSDCFTLAGAADVPAFPCPMSEEEADHITDYFIHTYAPFRSPKNRLDQFEGFIYEGPEYLTLFSGSGEEIETVPFPFPRLDDGLLWGDYAMPRIEPCNRVDRFLSGVAYLDSEHPYLIVCRGYYTRTCIAAYDLSGNTHTEFWKIDSGFVPMRNPFCDNPHLHWGSDPVYGHLAGQGNHSLSTADVDGDGCMEIIYGGACIDHDGTLLYSSEDYLPNGKKAKLGHGDSMHVARIDPDRPGFQIFNVFEGAKDAPYGYALRDAETGEVLFGEYAESDLGRCMIGDITEEKRGLQVWVNDVYDCKGSKLSIAPLSTNQCIHYAPDLTTQFIDSSDYLAGDHIGIVQDHRHGILLHPQDTATNNGTKGNPCLVANIFGDYREDILLRLADDSAIRIYVCTQLSHHKLFCLMQDPMYRCGVAWQNNCYNQPGYTSFYYASDMDFNEVL